MKIIRPIAETCDNGPCPTTYEIDDPDNFAFLGQQVTDPEALANVDAAPGEVLILVPKSLLAQHNRKVGS